MKKILTLVMAIVMVFSLCACGSTAANTQTAQAAQPQQVAQTPIPVANVSNVSTVDPSSTAGQIELIYKSLGSIMSDDGTNQYYYTVTDLDHNGKLELIAALTSGDASNTTGKIVEVNSTYDGFNVVNLNLGANEYLPEIIVASTDVFKDSSNNYYYIYTDTTGVGYGQHYESKIALSLQNGSLVKKVLAHKDIEYVNGITVVSYVDANGNSVQDVPSFDFANIANTVFSGYTKSTAYFDWCKLSDITSSQRLASSYAVFAGNATPSAAPAVPVATAAPAPTPTSNIWVVDSPYVTITKNPTSESVKEYGSCMFVAQATGFNSVRWELISPYGATYDARYNNPFPGSLQIYGATGTTLTLSGIPLDMNGWAARAIFEGNKNTATSNAANVYVTATPIEYVTISFSPSSGSYFTDPYQYVTVYSSNGQPIRVEATMSGDTGAYYSETLSSGSAFPVKGISGQVISVYVVATCGNSQANASFTVDCSPYIPTPSPEPPIPTYVPGGETKSGVVSDVNNEGGTYVGVNFDDGSYGRYDISYMISNPPQVGDRCTCTFGPDGVTLTGFSYYGGEY